MLQRSIIGTPHNQYLNILVEFGAVGLALWCWFLVVTFRTGLRTYGRLTDPVHRTFVLGWLGVFTAMMAGGITGDYMIHSIRNGGLELFSGYYLQWVLLGGMVAVGRIEQAAKNHAAADEPSGASPRRILRRQRRLVIGPAADRLRHQMP